MKISSSSFDTVFIFKAIDDADVGEGDADKVVLGFAVGLRVLPEKEVGEVAPPRRLKKQSADEGTIVPAGSDVFKSLNGGKKPHVFARCVLEPLKPRGGQMEAPQARKRNDEAMIADLKGPLDPLLCGAASISVEYLAYKYCGEGSR